LEAKVLKCAIVIFNGEHEDKSFAWQWGENDVPVKSSYTYLGVEFDENCKWERNVAAMIEKGGKALATYHKLLKAKSLPVSVKRQLLVTCIRPTLEYGGGVWEPSKEAYIKLERVQLRAAKAILYCAKSTPSVAVRGDLGLETLEDRRDVAKLMWWHKVQRMSEGRYPKMAFQATWPKLKKGADVKSWATKVKTLVKEMDIGDEALDWERAAMEKWVKEKLELRRCERAKLKEGRKVEAYHSLKDMLEFQPYLRGCLTLGTKLKFKFRAGSHGLEEETGRRQGHAREQRVCKLCDQQEVESVDHFIWSCPLYTTTRTAFIDSLTSCCDEQTLSSFLAKDNHERTTLILSHSHWGKASSAIDSALKDYLASAWVTRCNALYGEKSFFKDTSAITSHMGAAAQIARGQWSQDYGIT